MATTIIPPRTSMPELPSDILLSDILPRLPVSCLLRFKLVSKQWCSVISTPKFARIHLNYHLTHNDDDYHSDQNHKLLLQRYTWYSYSLDFETLDFASDNAYMKTKRCFQIKTPKDVRIFTSLHGLVCLGINNPSFERHNFYEDLVLWNPSTGSYKKLPNSNSYRYGNGFGVFYDSNSYNHGDGFGLFYDSPDDDYRLLVVLSKNGQAYIYSLKSDSWRKVQSILSVQRTFSCSLSRGYLANGNMYFMAKSSSHMAILSSSRMLCYSIISFDLKTEKVRELAPPPTRIGEPIFQSLNVLRGCIHVGYVYNGVTKKEMELWRLDGNERVLLPWVKASSFFISNVTLMVEPLYVMKNGNLLMFDSWGGLVFRFNPEEDIDDDDDDDRYVLAGNREKYMFQTMIYTETLISPNL